MGEEKLKAYKVFDKNWQCRGYQYEVGKTYVHDGEISLCESGFHACINLADCFKYKSFNPEHKIAEVELSGKIIKGYDKCVASKITVTREVSWQECLTLVNSGDCNSGNRNSGDYNSGYCNSGDYNSGKYNSGYRNSGNYNSGNRNSGDYNSGKYNSGYRNSGNYNSGYRNSGNYNSGDCNSGYRNSGKYNSGNYNSGDFNTDEPTVRLFNKDTGKLRHQINFPDYYSNFKLNEWISSDSMTDAEKQEHPEHETLGGYLKTRTYHEAWAIKWERDSEENKRLFLYLPNFDADIFREITGIDVSDMIEQKEGE